MKKTKTRKTLFSRIRHASGVLILTALISMSAYSPAWAEEPVTNQNAYTLPIITVTADKRPTDLQKTPSAITVLSAQDIEDKNITTLAEALNYVPNLTQVTYSGGETYMSFRGATSNLYTGTSPLIIYMDGVPVNSTYFLDANLVNVERIEFLRGAQGVVYGKNAFAGVINIISKKPDNTVTGKAFVDIGSLGSWGAGSNVSGPIVEDTLYIALAAATDYSAGWMDHPDSDEDDFVSTQMAKGQLRYTPNENVEINFYADYITKRKGIEPYVIGNHWQGTTPAISSDQKNFDTLNLALHGEFNFNDMLLTSITTYRHEYYEGSFDTRPILMPIYGLGAESAYEDRISEITQEFRLQNKDSEKGNFNWMVGIFAGYRDWDRPELSGTVYFGGAALPTMRTNYPFKEKSKEFAPFAQVEIPFTEKLRLTAGVRWQYTQKEAEQALTVTMLAAGTTTGSYDNPDNSWDAILPRLTLSYDITDEHMVYVGVSRGFLPGGYNPYYTAGGNNTFDPQYAWNYELGLKTSWLNQKLLANAVFFYTTYEDLQVIAYDGAKATAETSNAAKATAYGAELELVAIILPGLTAQAALGYTHTKYDEYIGAYKGVRTDFSGNRMDLTPKLTANASLTYRHESGFMASAGAKYTSEFYWEAANENSRGDVITVDAKVGYETETFDIYAYGTNIFNEEYLTFYGADSDFGWTAAPAEFGIRVVYKF